MSREKLTEQLQMSLKKLEKTAEKIINTRGYTRELESIRMMSELIKEQLINEDSRHSTRPTR